jgi:hypothetical protein
VLLDCLAALVTSSAIKERRQQGAVSEISFSEEGHDSRLKHGF